MEESIGRYIQRTLRSKGILNKDAGESIGISESAFEKLLTKDDILLSRLLKLSKFADINFFEYLDDVEPISTFKKQIQDQLLNEIRILNEKLDLKEQPLNERERTIDLQQQLIEQLRKELNRK